MFDTISYILSKNFISESLEGAGALLGKNVIISSITPIDGGNRITFTYTLDNGTVKDSTLDVMDGIDGQDGHTPVKGTDYWTQEDINELKTYCQNYINTQLLGGAS